MNMPQIIFFILIIILLILSALVIAINSKIYMNNDGIKRGGTGKDIIEFLKKNNIKIKEEQMEVAPNACELIYSSKNQFTDAVQDYGDAAVVQTILSSLDSYGIEYTNTITSEAARQIDIKVTFPNFFSNIVDLQITLAINPVDTYNNIKSAIWDYCIDNRHINSSSRNRDNFIDFSYLDACDENGWTISKIEIYIDRESKSCKINNFITLMEKINALDNIIFIPRGYGAKEDFVKNKVYGRWDISMIFLVETQTYFIDYYKLTYYKFLDYGYCGIRKVQGDGNCYFTSFMFNLLEYAVYSKGGVKTRLIKNIIDSLNSVKSVIDERDIYDSSNYGQGIGNIILHKETMRAIYPNMITTLTEFLNNPNSNIFGLERLFNMQNKNGDINGDIFYPLIYGCRQIYYQYIKSNEYRINGEKSSIYVTLSTAYGRMLGIDDKFTEENNNIDGNTDEMTTKLLARGLLLLGSDLTDIIQIAVPAYIFKCDISVAQMPESSNMRNVVGQYLSQNTYNDPYIRFNNNIPNSIKDVGPFPPDRTDVNIGVVSIVLKHGHYDILYHKNNVPNPIPTISPIFKHLQDYSDEEGNRYYDSSKYSIDYDTYRQTKHDPLDDNDTFEYRDQMRRELNTYGSKSLSKLAEEAQEDNDLEAAIALSLSGIKSSQQSKQQAKFNTLSEAYEGHKQQQPKQQLYNNKYDETYKSQLAPALSASEAEAKRQLAQHKVDHYTNAANTWTKYIKTENYKTMQQLLESPQVDQEGNIIQIPNSAYIQIAFPNFRKGIDTILISINEDTNNIYFNIKSAIWKWSLNTIKTNRERKKSYFRNAYIDARDKNGWVIDSFIIKEHAECKIKTFIESLSKNELENIIFMPRGDGSNQSFVKNKVFGREDLSILYRSENAFSKENSKLVCTKSIELGYCGHRRVQGDGNCYYTSFIFNLLEYAIFSQQDIRTQIIYNVIYAINSLTFAENEHIYNKKQIIIDRNHISDEDISNNTKLLPRLLYELNSMYDPNYTIIDLEHLFNRQVPDGKISRLFIVLIYAIRKLLYNYIKNNYKRLEKCPSSIIPITNFMEYLNNKYPLINASKDYFINLLIMDEDIDEITEFSFFAYIFKCAQYDFSLPNNKIQMVKTKEGSIDNFGERSNYTKYVDPFTARANIYNEHIDPNPDFIPSNLTGVVNCVLSGGHYDIIYHSNNVPNPIPTISPIFKKLIIDGYYTDVGMSSKAVEISYTDMGMSSTDVEMSSTDVEMSSKAVEISSKAVEMPIVVKQPVKSLRVNYSNEIINNALRDLYSTDGENGINILIKCKRQKINDNRFDSSALDSHILFLANKFLEEINSVKTSVIGSLVDVYANLDNSWRAQKYMDEFEKYRKQYKNDKEFSEQITKYFSSNITPHKIKNNEITNNDKIYDIVYEHTIKVCQRISNKLYGNNICNILIIGAIEWDKNNNIFIPPLNFTGKTNFIYCDIRLIDNVIAHNSRNYECKIEDTYIKYILDTNHSQIFYPFQNLKKSALMKFLECLFDYITFDTGVLGDPSLIITRDSLITELYPLLKQNGKIYFENVKKGIKTNNNIETETAHWVIFNKKGTAESVDSNFVTRLPKLPMVARTYNSTTKSEYYDPPLDFEKVYHDWAIQANETTQKENMDIAKEKGKKLKKTKPNIIIKYKKDGSKYINPLIKDCSQKGSNEYNIEISFSKEYCDEI